MGGFGMPAYFGMLVETHSWKDYATRVHVTHSALVAVLAQIGTHGAAWLQIAHDADQRASALGGQDVALDYKASDAVITKPHTAEMIGCSGDELLKHLISTLPAGAELDEPRPQRLGVRIVDHPLEPRLAVGGRPFLDALADDLDRVEPRRDAIDRRAEAIVGLRDRHQK